MLPRLYTSLVPAFSREIDSLFRDVLSEMPTFGLAAPSHGSVLPRLNVIELPDSFEIEADVPGLALDQLELTVRDDHLTLKGQLPARDAGTNGSVLRCERACGEFERTIGFAVAVDPEAVTASLGQGVLRVRLPKVKAHQPRKIEIMAS